MEPTKYRVEVSQKAAQMLVSHAAFLAQVSLNAAKRLTASFQEAADSLEIMPQRCSWLKGEHIPKSLFRIFTKEKKGSKIREKEKR